jgi:hypothetical protein
MLLRSKRETKAIDAAAIEMNRQFHGVYACLTKTRAAMNRAVLYAILG